MMGEINKILNTIDVSTEYRVVNIDGKKVYIEGVKSLGYINSENVLIKLKSKDLDIVGSNLKIKYLDKSTCVLEGEIKAVQEK